MHIVSKAYDFISDFDPVRDDAELEADIAKARLLAYWQDSRFNIMGFRFGADAILGLLPGIGDAITSVAGLYPVFIAGKYNLGRDVQARMIVNLGLDFMVGVVPVVGDIADAAFRANLKNVALLEKAAQRRLRRKK